MTGGTSQIAPQRREEGNLQSVKRMLYGPIGVGLKQRGLVNQADLCNGTKDGEYNFQLPRGNVSIQLGTPTNFASLPHSFDTDYSATLNEFERKILVKIDGQVQEAFYFNCSSLQPVGGHLSYQDEESSYRLQQIFWDTANPGEEWVEIASKEFEYDTNNLIGLDSFIIKFSTLNPGWDVWLIDHEVASGGTNKIVGRRANSFLYTQETFLTSFDTTEYQSLSYKFQAEDQKWDIPSGTRYGPITPLETLDTPVAPMDGGGNIFLSYTAEDVEMGMADSFWSFSF